MMNQMRNSRLAIFLGSVLACVLCAGAALPDNGANEKLLNAIRDADLMAARALLSGGADANAKDDDGLTALMYAAMYAGADCVELLLAQGADPNAKSKSDLTALMLAIGQTDKVRLLLAKGANVNAVSKTQDLPRIQTGTVEFGGFTPLLMAVPFGPPEPTRP